MTEPWGDHGVGEVANVAAQFPGQKLLERLSKIRGHWSQKGQHVAIKPKSNDHKIHELLKKVDYKGSGSFATVHKCNLFVNGQATVVATKEITQIKPGSSKKAINQEINTFKGLQHRHLVTYIGSYTVANIVTIIMFPCTSCNLKQLLEKLEKAAQYESLRDEASDQLTELGWASDTLQPAGIHPHLRQICGCIASGLLYLEQKKIRHKDIKPENILVDRDGVYITDFGVSGNYDGQSSTRTSGSYSGTMAYSAPEALLGGERGSPSDVYSLGLVFLDIFTYITGHSSSEIKTDYTTPDSSSTNGMPSAGKVERDANLKIMLAAYIFHGSGRESDEIRDLIHRMISKNEQDRPHVFEVITELWAISPEGQYFCESCHQHKECFGYKGLLKRYRLLRDQYQELQRGASQDESDLSSQAGVVVQVQAPPSPPSSVGQGVKLLTPRRSTPALGGPVPQTTRDKNRARPPIARNKNGDRLDLAALNFARNRDGLNEDSIDRLNELQTMHLCREQYLKKDCRNRSSCEYNHDEELDDGDLEMLDYLVRAHWPCKRGKTCQLSNCIYGHLCPQGSSPEVHVCNFSADMHVSDIFPVWHPDTQD